MPSYDSIVIGAGVIGASAALHLAESGSTLLIERFDFLHERGSSHGGSRIFRHAYGETHHVRLAQAADQTWQALEARTGERLLLKTGGLDIGFADSTQVAAVCEALTAAGSHYELLDGAEASRRFPAFALDEGSQVVYQPDAGILPATRAVATVLRAAAASGVELLDGVNVIALRPSSDAVEVRTERGTFSAGRVVVAAGPWLGRLVPELGLPLKVIKQQVLYLKVANRSRDFAPYRMPVFIDHRSKPTGEIYGFPLFEQPHAVKVGDHAGAQPADPDSRSFELDGAWAVRTAATAKRLLPGLSGEIASGVTCLYTKTPDEHFVLDRHPRHPNIVLAGAGSGHAFKFGPVLGEAAAELATRGASRFDLSHFALARFGAGGS